MAPRAVVNQLYTRIREICERLVDQFDQISDERQQKLAVLADYVLAGLEDKRTPKVIVICTHNSRRSQLGQVWLSIAADFYSLEIAAYSGGTEATAFYNSAVGALQSCGVKVSMNEKHSSNPVYRMRWKNEGESHEYFSKKFDDPANPSSEFAAVMVCDSAAEACPYVPGCDLRLAIPYIDPKHSDHTAGEANVYYDKALEIGCEMLYVMSLVAIKKGVVT